MSKTPPVAAERQLRKSKKSEGGLRTLASIAGKEFQNTNYLLITFFALLLLTAGAVAGIYGWVTFQRITGGGAAVLPVSKLKDKKASEATYATSATRIKRATDSEGSESR